MLKIIAIFIGIMASYSFADNSSVLTTRYESDKLYTLQLSPLYVTSFHFQGTNKIENVYCGDSSSWEVLRSTAMPNVLLVKPKKINSKTDLIVQVDGKTVLFGLESVQNLVKMPIVSVNMDFSSNRIFKKQEMSRKDNSYSFFGDESLRPLWVFDNNQYTYIAWHENQAMPAIYKLGPNKQLALTNFRIRGQFLLLPRLSACWLLKRGSIQAVIQQKSSVSTRSSCRG
jgi:type IV secretory pathway VirB9-like protein